MTAADAATDALLAGPPAAAPVPPDAERQAAPLLAVPTPCAPEIEMAALGAMLTSPDVLRIGLVELRPDDFFRPEHADLFRLTREIAHGLEEDERLDAATVHNALCGTGLYDRLGGQAYLVALVDACPAPSNIRCYAKILRDKTMQRAAVQAGLELARQAGQPKADVPGLLKALDARMRPVVEPRDTIGKPQTAAALVAQFPHLRPEVICGWLRRGEVGTLAAASKKFKSWLLMYTGLCKATGRPVFDRFPTRQGRVLLVDYELSPGTLGKRLRDVAEGMGIDLNALADLFCVVSLRGRRLDIAALGDYLEALGQDFELIILDPMYRLYPADFDENGNADMAALFGNFQRIAENLDAALLICHHLSKGPQGDKPVVDLGSGGGAQARATDALIGLRHHATEGAAVVSGVVRSFPPFSDFVIRWDWPLWRVADDLDPLDLRRPPRRHRTPAAPAEPAPPPWTVERLAEVLTDAPQARAAIIDAARQAGAPSDRQVVNLLASAVAGGKAFLWKQPRDKRTFYATKPQPALLTEKTP